MSLELTSSLLGAGVYSLNEAARLASVPQSSFRRWLLGYQYSYKDERRIQPPVVHHSRAAEADDVFTITFQI